MAVFTEIAIFAILAGLIYYFLTRENKHKNLPPGPKGLPLVGNLFSLSFTPHIRFGEWAKEYGNIFWMKLVNYRIVLISDAQVAREAFNNNALLAKPDFPLFDTISEGIYGIFGSSGTTWVEQRRFTLRHLRDFGFGKTAIHDLYMAEVNEFVEWLKKNEGESISLNKKFSLAAINSLWMIMTGKRFKQNDNDITSFLDSQNEMFRELSKSPLALFFPKLAMKFPTLSGWGKMDESIDKFKAMMQEPVVEHIKDFDPDSPRDFVDAYLKEVLETSDSTSSFYKDLGHKNLETILGDLFGAGTETTAQTMSFAILFLTKFPEIQKKFQAEIDTVVGKTRQVTLEDRKNLPFVEACILETIRKSPVAPFGVFHAAAETTMLAGYTIPKGTWIGVNIHYVLHDPNIWGDPENFRPERFLSPDGTKVVRNDNMIAFSVGKRICIGEQLARDGIFLFLSNIFQKFTTRFDPNLPEPTMDGTIALFTNCDIYNVILKDRIG